MSQTIVSERARKAIQGRVAGTDSVLQIEFDSAIQNVDDLIRPPETSAYLAPGFIDVQVNGFAGVDYNNPGASAEAIAGSICTMFMTGVTRFFPTVITGSRETMLGAIANLAKAKDQFSRQRMPEGEAMQAFHIEGPHISPEDGPRGAHPLEHVRPPDVEEFRRWQEAAQGSIRLVTLSPEWSESAAYTRELVKNGVVVSIGHTKATSAQLQAVVDSGATMSTHLGNAAHPVLPKTANYLWEQLSEERLSPSFIVDGIHIPASFFRAAIRAKGADRCILVTDAVMPSMCEPGFYQLGQVDVELKIDGSVVKRGEGRLAGSALRMDHAIGNSVRQGQIGLPRAISMATVNPARVARVAGRQRGLSPGEKADLIRYEWDEHTLRLRVLETIVAGKSVYQA